MAAFLAVLTALPALIQSLPYLFQIVLKLMNLVGTFIAWSQKNDLTRFLNDCEATIDKLDKAKTPEDKRNAARGMVDLIRKLG